MHTLDILCPRCKSPQKFGKQKREIKPGIFEVYIKCRICRWEEVIIRGDSDTINTERDITRLRARAKNDDSIRKVLQRKINKRI